MSAARWSFIDVHSIDTTAQLNFTDLMYICS